ncbi:hypothetical protein [Streptomyces werraensis]|uniref:hypothetical protein n=1 Tax=Streptomyces werraensis TaxID=68284 RepID=UPI0036B6E1DB
MSEAEREARRTSAYCLAASEALSREVRLSAAAALEALDKGIDDESTQTAVAKLVRTVYDCRTAR